MWRTLPGCVRYGQRWTLQWRVWMRCGRRRRIRLAGALMVLKEIETKQIITWLIANMLGHRLRAFHEHGICIGTRRITSTLF